MPGRITCVYVDSSRNSGWLSEAVDNLDYAGQLAIDVVWLDSHENQTFAIPLPGIPICDIAKIRCACVTPSTLAMGHRDGVIRLCDQPKADFHSACDWITELKRIWANGPASTLELAKAVAAAKKPARRGQWREIWKGLPFSRRKADMLAVIGEQLDWVNWQTFASLPVGWSILYELSKLKRPAFEEFVRLGLIHPGLKLCEARKLVAPFQGKTGEGKQGGVRERLLRFEQFVGDTLLSWTAEEQELGRARLTLSKRFGQPSSFGFELGFYPENNDARCRRIDAFRSGFSA